MSLIKSSPTINNVNGTFFKVPMNHFFRKMFGVCDEVLHLIQLKEVEITTAILQFNMPTRAYNILWQGKLCCDQHQVNPNCLFQLWMTFLDNIACSLLTTMGSTSGLHKYKILINWCNAKKAKFVCTKISLRKQMRKDCMLLKVSNSSSQW